MKKLLSVVVLFISALFLVACGSAKSGLDGEYYKIYDGEAYSKVFEIENGKGFYYPDGSKTKMKVDEEEQTITYTSRGVVFQLTYKYEKSGILVFDGPFGGDTVYKKDSKAYEEELKNSKK